MDVPTSSRRDLQADRGAMMAGIGARAAFGERVLLAFVLARLADFRAILAYQVDKVAIPGHEGGCQTAEIGAILIQRKAMGEPAAFGFLVTGGGAAIAGFGAGQAGIDAGLMGFS